MKNKSLLAINCSDEKVGVNNKDEYNKMLGYININNFKLNSGKQTNLII